MTTEARIYDASPVGQEFHADNSRVRGIMGPIGSGKSVMCCMEIVARAHRQAPHHGVRSSRWAVIRSTYPELRTTTIKTWSEWVDPRLAPVRMTAPISCTLRAGLPDGTLMDLEVLFLALDQPGDVRKLLSLELTGAWINEAREINREHLDMLSGRIDRYPSMARGGATWTGIIMDSNPPPRRHWWYQMAEEVRPTGWRFFRQPPALLRDADGRYRANPLAENVANHRAGHAYWTNLLPGKEAEWINVYVLGEYGNIWAGKAVYDGSFVQGLHVAGRPLVAHRGMPLYLGWDLGLCYSDDTEVLTDSGWKLFKDVDERSDKAATRNPETGEMSYANIGFKIEEDYSGDMLEWSSTELNLLITPEHRVPFTHRETPNVVRWESAQWLADHMTGHHFVDLVSSWRGSDTTVDMKLGKMGRNAQDVQSAIPLKAFAPFMGLWLSEGCGDENRIQIYQKHRRTDMQQILDATGWPFVWAGDGWRCNRSRLARSPFFCGNAHAKRVPTIIKNATAETIKDFIGAYTLGDGHVRRRESGSVEHTIATVSKDMADDLMELAQKVGWNASIHRWKPTSSVINEKEGPRTITNHGIYSVTFKKRARRAELHKRNFKRIPYKGKVYCLNVPFHTLYVRRKGKPSWNGNTPACVAGQMTAGGQLRILREWVGADTGLRQFVQTAVAPALANEFPGMTIISTCDPAGVQRSQADEATCVAELGRLGIPSQPAATNKFGVRRQSVISFLQRSLGDEPGFLIDPSCASLIEAMAGGYQFARLQVGGGQTVYADERDGEPLKNTHSHIAEACQYLCVRLDPPLNADRAGTARPERRAWG